MKSGKAQQGGSVNENDLYRIAMEPIAVLRKRFITICDDNHCAAMLLDIFSAREASAREFAQYFETEDSGEYPPYLYTTIAGLAEQLFGLFDTETVEDSFEFLLQRRYISRRFLSAGMKVQFDREAVREAYKVYGIDFDKPRRPKTAVIREGIPTPLIGPEDIVEVETARVDLNNKRAVKAHLPATLTVEQWLETVNYFNGKCAYCQDAVYTLLEHFIPIVHGGGTTQGNCVPACSACNGMKQAWNPLSTNRPEFPCIEEGFKRVQAYFSTIG